MKPDSTTVGNLTFLNDLGDGNSTNKHVPSESVLHLTGCILMGSIVACILSATLFCCIVLTSTVLRNKPIYMYTASLCINHIVGAMTGQLSFAIANLNAQVTPKLKGYSCDAQLAFIILPGAWNDWQLALTIVYRYIIIAHNRCYRKMSVQKTITTILISSRFIPLTMFLYSLEPFAKFCTYLNQCVFGSTSTIVNHYTLNVAFPCVIIVVAYVQASLSIKRKTRSDTDTRKLLWLRRQRRILETFIAIEIIYFIAYSPYMFLRFSDNEKPYICDDCGVIIALVTFCSINSFPVILIIFDRHIRRSFLLRLRSRIANMRDDELNTQNDATESDRSSYSRADSHGKVSFNFDNIADEVKLENVECFFGSDVDRKQVSFAQLDIDIRKPMASRKSILKKTSTSNRLKARQAEITT